MEIRLKDVEAIYHSVLEKKSPAERSAFLDLACKNNPALRTQVEVLLNAHEQVGDFLDAPVFDPDVTLDNTPPAEGPGSIIGRYKLLEKIGEGGMAVVYMAEQKEPIRRKVALKIIKLGMDTRQVIARFEAERQALAIMDHPNIAKVLDAGATETGRPYFVMELVKGVSVTEYCDKNKLSTKERLDLFLQVCNAVQHAHQKGIIHRDIKPSNVMVTHRDGTPVPKIIDFGIAKATNQRLTEKTLFTRYAHIIGTPAYMSPEQAELGTTEVDIRTDVYSLAVLLYELLTGATPFSQERLREAGYVQMQQIICTKEPTRPSSKIQTSDTAVAAVAAHRGTTPSLLRKLLRHDLDWIVMKGLEKERHRRYATAGEVAADVQRHLHHEPVQAVAPSVSYRLSKFARRNRVAVVTIALVMGATLMGATAATLTMWRDKHATGPVLRRVWDAPPASKLGGISHDGRYISYVDWTAGNLAIHDLTTEMSWLVTKNTSWDDLDGWNETSVVSPDGRQIAYSWFNEKGLNFYDLRIIDVGGTNMRVLYHDAAVFWVRPYDWSPDGKDILAYFSDADQSLVDEKTGELFSKGYLALVSAADGSARILKTWHKRSYPKMAVFSPDERFIAYDFAQDDDRAIHDIFLMELNSGDEVRVVRHPADDQLCGWTPDGQGILFASNRTSSTSLWMIEVADGLPRGSPKLLKGQFEGFPIGFVANGSYYYGVPTKTSDVLLTSLDPKSGDLSSQGEIVSPRFVGATRMCDWSVEGENLAYAAEAKASLDGDRCWVFVIYSVKTGQERILVPSPKFHSLHRWGTIRLSPNGGSLLVHGDGFEEGKGLYKVDIETGTATRVVSTGSSNKLYRAVWSADGNSIHICSEEAIVHHDLTSGKEIQLYHRVQQWPVCIDISPDGRWLAFFQDRHSLVVMPSAGGEPQQVVDLGEHEIIGIIDAMPFVRWTPDGEHLLFPRHANQLCKVNVQTGRQQQIGPKIHRLADAAIQPGGQQIALTVIKEGSQLWVMENFLPD